jgi:isocitrate/isopropylmalate dehydrogenase
MTTDPTAQAAPVRIAVMGGDGIGPEITAATMAVLRLADRAFKLGLSFAPVSIGMAALHAQGTTFPQAALEAAKAADGVILGPVSHNDYPPAAEVLPSRRLFAETARQEPAEPVRKHPCVRGALAVEHARFIE